MAVVGAPPPRSNGPINRGLFPEIWAVYSRGGQIGVRLSRMGTLGGNWASAVQERRSPSRRCCDPGAAPPNTPGSIEPITPVKDLLMSVVRSFKQKAPLDVLIPAMKLAELQV